MKSKTLRCHRRQALAALLGCALLPSTSAAPRPATSRLVLGDSLSAEYGIAPGSGWVALMGRHERLKGWQLFNASVSGETSAGGKARLSALLKLHQPAWVFLELGSNDALRGLPLDALRRNLDAMITDIKATGAQVFLIGAQMPGNYGPAFNKSLLAVYADLARQHQLPWMPHLLRSLESEAQPQDWLQGDQLHPLAKAHPRILQDILATWPVTAKPGRRP